jgi:hypothetical protein
MYIYYLNESERASHSEREYQKVRPPKANRKQHSTACSAWGKKKVRRKADRLSESSNKKYGFHSIRTENQLLSSNQKKKKQEKGS